MIIVQVEELVEPGEIKPDDIHLPGIYIQRIVKGGNYDKRIEKLTLRKAAATANGESSNADESSGGKSADPGRDRIVKRAAKEFKDGMYVNLGQAPPFILDLTPPDLT